MTRVAAIDCGTNSIRLLVADVDSERSTLTDVDRTGRLAPEALARTFVACDRYADVVRRTGAERVRFVATSATRDVANRDEFAAGVRDRFGVEPEVVSGDTEAELSFTGATRELAGSELARPFLVVDIGGGSTELVLGDPGSAPQAARSVDVGSVRMTERHLVDDPPTSMQVAAARADVEAAVRLAGQTVPLGDARTLVGLAGSVTTVAAMALDLPAYQPDRIHHAHVPADDVRRVAQRLLTMTHDERAALPFLHPGRVDVIGAGALILAVILDHVPVDEVVVSEHDILDGIAWSILER